MGRNIYLGRSGTVVTQRSLSKRHLHRQISFKDILRKALGFLCPRTTS